MSKIQWIEHQGACDRALESLSRSTIWAVDTEADFDNHAYGKKLALIQILGDQEPETAYLFDPLSGINLKGIKEAFQNQSIQKILYAGDTDNRLFHEIWGVDIENIWDVYQAAQALGLPRFGLGALCEEFLGIKTTDQKEKFQRANWLQRPLSDDKKAYAAEDVFYLIPLYHKLLPLFDTPKKTSKLRV
jgi:ribonuclease D